MAHFLSAPSGAHVFFSDDPVVSLHSTTGYIPLSLWDTSNYDVRALDSVVKAPGDAPASPLANAAIGVLLSIEEPTAKMKETQ